MQHFRTIPALPLVLGEGRQEDTDYLNTCRIKRNTVEYDMAGVATDADASELLAFATQFRGQVLDWVKSNHPDLSP